MVRLLYRLFGYLGIFSIFSSMLYGFRYDPLAPGRNYLFDIILYGAWAGAHLIMTRSWFKEAVYGSPAGSPFERRVYIAITIVTWWSVLWLHRALPGPVVGFGTVIRFLGMTGFLMCILAFFEGGTFAVLDGLIAAPGTEQTHTQGAETPLLTEGQYAKVRHPMYRAALCAGACSLLVHPNMAQLLWVLLIGGTFVAFIPIEEAQLVAARGEAYLAYSQRTQYRLFRGVW